MPSENKKYRGKTELRQHQDRQRKSKNPYLSRRTREEASKLQKLLQQVIENEERSLERNEVLKRDIKRVNDHGQALERRTEELKALKRNYEEEVLRLYPHYFRSLRGNYGLLERESSEMLQGCSQWRRAERVSSNPELYENGRRRLLGSDEDRIFRQSSSLFSFRPRPSFTSSPYDGYEKSERHILPNFNSLFENEKELDRGRKSTFSQRIPPPDPFAYSIRHHDTLRNEFLRPSDIELPSANSHLSFSPERELKVIPQVLALSPNGKVILLPMTVPFPSQDEKHSNSYSNQPITEDSEPFGVRRTPDGGIRSIATPPSSNNDLHMHRATDAGKSAKKGSDHPETYFIDSSAQEQYRYVSHNPQRKSPPMSNNTPMFNTEEHRYNREACMPPVTSPLVSLSANRNNNNNNNNHVVLDDVEDVSHFGLSEEKQDLVPSSPNPGEMVRGLLTEEERNATGEENVGIFPEDETFFMHKLKGCYPFESQNCQKMSSQSRNYEQVVTSDNLDLENYSSNAPIYISSLTNGLRSMELNESHARNNVRDVNCISLQSNEEEEPPLHRATKDEEERRETTCASREVTLSKELRSDSVPLDELEAVQVHNRRDDDVCQMIATRGSSRLTEEPLVVPSPLTSAAEHHKEELVLAAEMSREDNSVVVDRETLVTQTGVAVPLADDYASCVDMDPKEEVAEEERNISFSSEEPTDLELSIGDRNHPKVVPKDSKALDVDASLTATEGGDVNLEDERLSPLPNVRRLSLDLGSISDEVSDTDTFDSQALTGDTERRNVDNKKASQEWLESSLAEDPSNKDKEKETEKDPLKILSPRSLMEAGSEVSQISSDEGDDELDDLLNSSLGLTSTDAVKRNVEHFSKRGDAHPDSSESGRSGSYSNRKARPLFGEDNVFGPDNGEIQASRRESDDEISDLAGEKPDSSSRMAANDQETKKTKNGRSPRSNTSQNGGRMSNDPNTDDKVSKSISERIRKPGFWDHSDSEPEMDLIGQTAGKEPAGDDDFDFEFFN